jgi:exodeoxyribonuclease III
VRLVTWNVNSVKQRLPRLLEVLRRHDPDVVCLQETKVSDDEFPHDEVATVGFRAAAFGQRAYNGVAILTRDELAETASGFHGDPVSDSSRVIHGRIEGIPIVCVYAVNGKRVGDPAYEVKLAWYDAFVAWLTSTFDPSKPLVVAGDFNVAPTDLDVHDPDAWRGRNLASEPERERIRRLLDWGLIDVGRRAAGEVPGPFTFWDYRAGAFHRGWGLRLDLVLTTEPVADRVESVVVDRNERKPTAGEGKPSDHAPLVVQWTDRD